MRLKRVRIENFRAFEDQTIELNDYTCLVGPNGSGKSTVLAALNVFFQESRTSSTNVSILSEEDFHRRRTHTPVQITLTFDSLTADAQEALKDYYRQGELVVTAKAEWNPDSRSAPVVQHGQRRVLRDFTPYFRARSDGAKVDQLRPIYRNLQESFGLPKASTGRAMEAALREYEESHPAQCSLELSQDQFYGFTGSAILAPFIQWVYVPAVMDAASEQDASKNSALRLLLDRTIRQQMNFRDVLQPIEDDAKQKYANAVEAAQPKLKGLSRRLEQGLRHWAHDGASLTLAWRSEADGQIVVREPAASVSAGERGFQGEIARLGHGLQRSFLVAVLQELALSASESAPRLLLAVEEPELYQHPPQARQFATLLERLAAGTAQALVTTHSPHFISAKGFESVRLVRPLDESKGASVSQLNAADLTNRLNLALGGKAARVPSVMARLEQILQPSQAEMFFSSRPILVEGIEDVALISGCLELDERLDEFHSRGCHFVVGGGKRNLSRLLATAQGLGIPAWVVFDCDGHDENARNQNERDNRCLLTLCGAPDHDPFPTAPSWGDSFACWPEEIMNTVKEDVGAHRWDEAMSTARETHGWPKEVTDKNQLLLVETLRLLWEHHPSGTLRHLCDRILN
ncbi:MAG: ATP-dependent nuclease [Myxococcota bacterium]